jgi:hypothetical protein
MKVIHAENSLDLGEESRQEPEISSGHPNELALLPERVARRQAFSFFKTFRSALACKDITTNNSESDRVAPPGDLWRGGRTDPFRAASTESKGIVDRKGP